MQTTNCTRQQSQYCTKYTVNFSYNQHPHISSTSTIFSSTQPIRVLLSSRFAGLPFSYKSTTQPTIYRHVISLNKITYIFCQYKNDALKVYLTVNNTNSSNVKSIYSIYKVSHRLNYFRVIKGNAINVVHNYCTYKSSFCSYYNCLSFLGVGPQEDRRKS